MKKIMTMVMMAMVMMMVVIPVKAEQADGIKPETTMTTEPEVEEIDYFNEVVEDVNWEVDDMSDEEGVVYTQKEINYETRTASWTIEMVDGSYLKAKIENERIHIDYKEGFYTVTADCTLQEYYEYDVM